MSEENEIESEGSEVYVEEPQAEKPQRPAPEPESSGDDELSSYSKGVQQRIKKLTERYRQEERDKAEALRVSQQLYDENQKLRQRMQALDTGYVSEYGTRLQTQLESAKAKFKRAYDAGDAEAIVEAQQELSQLAIEQQRYNTAKLRLENDQRARAQQPAPQAAPVQQPVQREPDPDPKAVSWKDRNTWFGQDKIMTVAAYAVHKELVQDEGFDPSSDEYYSELDRRLRKEFPQKFAAKKTGGNQVASAGNSASRSTNPGRRSVKLTHSQVAIAKKLGVPLEEYAKYVKE